MSEPFLGEIRLVGFTYAPSGWAMCQGQLLQISQYSALYSLLGTLYGGDGRSTFGLPNLQSRVAIGPGQLSGGSQFVQGQVGGQETVTLNTSQMPNHTHTATLSGSDQPPAQGSANAGYLPSNGGRGTPLYASSVTTLQPLAGTSVQLSPTGGSQPHPNLQPYLVLNYIIALQGIYPPRP